MAKQYSSQSVESDSSSPEGALAQTEQSSIDRISPKKMAQGTPREVQGYESLGKARIHIPKDNRGDGT